MTSGRVLVKEEKDEDHDHIDEEEDCWNGGGTKMNRIPKEDDSDDDVTDESEEDSRPSRTKRLRRNLRSPKASSGSGGGSAGSATFQCNKCTAIYYKLEGLNKHIERVHQNENKEDIATCPICNRLLLKGWLHSHLQNHADAETVEEDFDLWSGWPKSSFKGKLRFCCKYCLLPHFSHTGFLSHMEKKHPDKGRFYKWRCNHCSTAEFESLRLLVIHMRSNHMQEYFGSSTLKWISSKEGPKPKIKPAKKERPRAGRGRKFEHNRPYNNTVTSLKKNCDTNQYPCPMENCNARLKSVQFLKSHFTLHLQNNPFVCPVPGCGVRCDAQCHLDRHMRHHTGELQVKCPKCGLSLCRKDKLLTHKCVKESDRNRFGHLRLHRIAEIEAESLPNMTSNPDTTNRKSRPNLRSIFLSDPVFIKVCEENPGFKELLFGHDRVEGTRNSRMFKCRKCNIGFNVRKSLEKHRRLCRGIKTVEDKGNCEDSDGKTKLGKEDRFQLKYGCRICGDYFGTRAQLNSHIKDDHATEQIFKCGKCEEVFPSDSKRLSHAKSIHLQRPSDKTSSPLKCSECGKELSNSDSLRRHWFLVHGVVKKRDRVSRTGKTAKNKQQPRSKRNIEKKSNWDSDPEDVESINRFQQEGIRSIPPATATLVKVEPELIIEADDDGCHIPKTVKLDPEPDIPEFVCKLEGNLKLENDFYETDMAIF